MVPGGDFKVIESSSSLVHMVSCLLKVLYSRSGSDVP